MIASYKKSTEEKMTFGKPNRAVKRILVSVLLGNYIRNNIWSHLPERYLLSWKWRKNRHNPWWKKTQSVSFEVTLNIYNVMHRISFNHVWPQRRVSGAICSQCELIRRPMWERRAVRASKSCEMLNFKQMTGEKQWEAKSQMLLEFNFQMRGEAVAGQ